MMKMSNTSAAHKREERSIDGNATLAQATFAHFRGNVLLGSGAFPPVITKGEQISAEHMSVNRFTNSHRRIHV